MEALRDPFSRVHPIFWPVLMLSLRAFVRWSGRMIEDGHGFAGLSIEITWYGWIHVTALDLSDTGAAVRRHMSGAEPEDGWAMLQGDGQRIDRQIAANAADPSAGWGPWINRATCSFVSKSVPWIPAFAGVFGYRSTGRHPPLHSAPPLAWPAAGRFPDFASPAARPSPLRPHVLAKAPLPPTAPALQSLLTVFIEKPTNRED